MKKRDEISKLIIENQKSLPISFNKIKIKENTNISSKNIKIVKSKFYKDEDYQIFSYYKSITQF